MHTAELIAIEVEVLGETDKALRVTATGEHKDAVWVPKSKTELIRRRGRLPELSLPEWLAHEKGLI